MRNADAALVERVVPIIEDAPLADQNELFTILGVFAEPLIEKERFVRLVGRERLMQSELLTYLMEEREAELKQVLTSTFQKQIAERDARLAERDARLQRQELQEALADAIVARFPDSPVSILRDVRRISSAADIRRLIVNVIQAPDSQSFARQLAEAAESASKN